MELDCVIYVATSNWEIVRRRITRDTPEVLPEGDSIRFPSLTLEWIHNGYEGTVQAEDDFIGWPYVMDCQAASSASLEEVIEVVSGILGALWAGGIRAVAACDYEDLLPRKGGAIQ